MVKNKKIRVIVVEDSLVKRELITSILNSDPDINVISCASDGESAIKCIKSKKPDIATMDINMPGMNGFETTKKILSECPIPIIMVSSTRTKENKEEIAAAMMKCGALQFIDTPPGPWHKDFDTAAKKIIQMVKAMSKVKIIKRHICNEKSHSKNNVNVTAKHSAAIVAIGVSTGGPPLLKDIISSLPKNFYLPIVIVQHIAVDFDSLLASHLNKSSKLNVTLAVHNDKITPGNVYIAPGNANFTITSDHKVFLEETPLHYNAIVPSVDALFSSINNVYSNSAIGILLTGMGKDGATELKKMKDNGAVTIIQDKKSSVIYGMPGEAKRLEAEKYIMNPSEIISYLLNLNDKKKS
jgi:two-component system, chemotaxis family, protein-glutamate methylesterase/glutaminase